MNGLLDALGLGGGMMGGYGGDGMSGGQGQGVSPLLTSLLSGVSSQAGAPDWLKSVNSWMQDPATQQGLGQFKQAMQGADRQYKDKLYDQSAFDARVANPYADIINEPHMRSLGLQTNAGRQMGNQGLAQEVYGPMLQNLMNSGLFKNMFSSGQQGGAPKANG